ncbi:hypothetical protein [Thiocapsa rosea]|uniref:hypothetical protein n=1 Tax=Thiocapsa rosea TaxID=69360 RepID=UPI0011C3B928|nr:hypothetical protein [Thiocapsa rosea]
MNRMPNGRRPLLSFLGLLLWGNMVAASDCPAPPGVAPAPYPTAVIADYVLGCMVANGQSLETIRRCSCSFDFIAAAIPYDDYETIETLMRMQQIEGSGRNTAFKGAPWAKQAIARFKEVQAESTLRCF